MAYQLDYIDNEGNHYPQSYWRPVFIFPNMLNKHVHAIFNGWKTKADYDAKRNPFENRLNQFIRSEHYDTYMSSEALAPEGMTMKRGIYLGILTDLIGEEPVPYSEIDENGNEIMITPPDTRKAFFTDAIEV